MTLRRWPIVVMLASAGCAFLAVAACGSDNTAGPARTNGCIGEGCYGVDASTDSDTPIGTNDAATDVADGPIVYGDPLAGTSKTATLVVGGYVFTEGPVWIGGRLLFSDTGQNTIFSLATDGTATTFRANSKGANGNAVDAKGRLITCEGNAGDVVRTDTSLANPAVVAGMYNGKPFDAPNDVIARADGTLYFTDPFYGTVPDGGLPQNQMAVYEIPAGGGAPLRLASVGFKQPNGIALSPDGNTLYVVDNGVGKVFKVGLNGDGSINGAFASFVDAAGGDGMAVDLAGNIYVAGTAGILVFDVTGKALGTITLPANVVPSNATFGDTDHKKLFITARNGGGAVNAATGVYAIGLNVPGLP